ncbi:MAG: efflux RND transporter periplasmic adaptor subunit, partial [Burkholderiaceae bacterium]|nr:efflux RND transporter periplasmic adaptor subunit [Burkholderiaceae bacterium]
MNRIQRAVQSLPPVLLVLMSCLPAWAVQPLGCLIEPFRVAEVGSPVIGVIETIRAERGDRVEKG